MSSCCDVACLPGSSCRGCVPARAGPAAVDRGWCLPPPPLAALGAKAKPRLSLPSNKALSTGFVSRLVSSLFPLQLRRVLRVLLEALVLLCVRATRIKSLASRLGAYAQQQQLLLLASCSALSFYLGRHD
eukprot:GHVT01078933.1.p2 GENE.GHVT01078933.1~~GHVT01078933.1.p2  ORF type:complete len:130 (-),score=23.37 GHVT01078933.1:250-639(-)